MQPQQPQPFHMTYAYTQWACLPYSPITPIPMPLLELHNKIRNLVFTSFVNDSVPSSCIPRPHSLIKTNTHRILRINFPIKCGFEVTMSSQTLLDETASPPLSPELQSLEPFHVLAVKEHISNCNKPPVNLIWMTSENDTLRNNAIWGGRERGACP